MNRRFSFVNWLFAVAVVVGLTATSRADSINANNLVLTISDGTNSAACSLSTLGTASGSSGTTCLALDNQTIAFKGLVGGFKITGQLGSSNVPGAPGGAEIDNSNVSITNMGTTAGSLTLTLTGYNFDLPSETSLGLLENSGSASAVLGNFSGGDLVTFQGFFDQLNGGSLLGQSTAACSIAGGSGAVGVGCPTQIGINGDTSQQYYSLSQNIVVRLGSGDAVNTSGSVGAVPEPSSMLLFGTGISGLAAFLRRRSSSKS